MRTRRSVWDTWKWLFVGLLLSILFFGVAVADGGKHRRGHKTPEITAQGGSALSEAQAKAAAEAAAGAAAGAEANAPTSVEIEGDQVSGGVFGVPPALVATTETCMGSSSGGAGANAGFVGARVDFGSTWENENCERRMYSRMLLAADGPKCVHCAKAALIILSGGMNGEIGEALQLAGVDFPKPAAKPEAKKEATAQPEPGSWEAQAAGFQMPGK